MNLTLAIAFQNESGWLRDHLPRLHRPAHWGLVGLDGGSADDSAALIRAAGGVIHERPFDWHFGNHMNALITACELEGYGFMLRLDPDELIFPDTFSILERAFEKGADVIALPRYAFIADRAHYSPNWHPDYQRRAIRLGAGLHYEGAVHEQLNYTDPRYLVISLAGSNPHHHIYHYGWTLPLEVRREREARYAALTGGNTDPAAHLRSGYPYAIPFEGDQP